MAIPILSFYLIGIVMFVIGLEENEDKIKTIIYLGLSFFINYMGYTLSYQDSSFYDSAYLPLVLMVFSVILAVYTAWNMIPVDLSWGDKVDEKDED